MKHMKGDELEPCPPSDTKRKKASRFYCFPASINNISKSFVGFRLGRHRSSITFVLVKESYRKRKRKNPQSRMFLLLLSWVWNLGPFGSLLTVRVRAWADCSMWHPKMYGSRFFKRAIRLFVGHHIHKYFIDQIKCEEFRHIMRTAGLVIMGHKYVALTLALRHTRPGVVYTKIKCFCGIV